MSGRGETNGFGTAALGVVGVAAIVAFALVVLPSLCRPTATAITPITVDLFLNPTASDTGKRVFGYLGDRPAGIAARERTVATPGGTKLSVAPAAKSG